MRLVFEALDLGFEPLDAEPCGRARKQLGHLRIVPDGIVSDAVGAEREALEPSGRSTLMGKAFAQMQLVAAELDPSLDPFSIAQAFLLRSSPRQLGGALNSQQVFYEFQKAGLRLNRLVEGVEVALGARPGASLQALVQGLDRLEGALDRASRRLSLVLGLSAILVTAGLTASRPAVPRWLPTALGGIGTAIAAGLLVDRPRSSA